MGYSNETGSKAMIAKRISTNERSKDVDYFLEMMIILFFAQNIRKRGTPIKKNMKIVWFTVKSKKERFVVRKSICCYTTVALLKTSKSITDLVQHPLPLYGCNKNGSGDFFLPNLKIYRQR